MEGCVSRLTRNARAGWPKPPFWPAQRRRLTRCGSGGAQLTLDGDALEQAPKDAAAVLVEFDRGRCGCGHRDRFPDQNAVDPHGQSVVQPDGCADIIGQPLGWGFGSAKGTLRGCPSRVLAAKSEIASPSFRAAVHRGSYPECVGRRSPGAEPDPTEKGSRVDRHPRPTGRQRGVSREVERSSQGQSRVGSHAASDRGAHAAADTRAG